MDPFLYHRSLIPAAVKGVYLDTATTGPFHRWVLQRLYRFYGSRYLHGGSLQTYQHWLEGAQEVRSLVASLINAHPREVSFTPNASTGINMAAQLIPFQKGDEVLVPDLSFPSGAYAFYNLASRGVLLRRIRSQGGAISFSALQKMVTEKTRAISLSQVEFASGFRHDLEAIGHFCQKQGIYLVVDATQGAGAMAIDVKKAKISFLSFSPYKWLCAPLGLGIFYCQQELMEKARPESVGWLSVKRPFAFEERPNLSDTGRRFEVGGLNYGGIQALGEAVRIHQEMGILAIEDGIKSRMTYLLERLQRLGVSLLGPYPKKHRSGILYLLLQPEVVSRAQEIFFQEGIQVHCGVDRIRVSIHYFNTTYDLDRFTAALQQALS